MLIPKEKPPITVVGDVGGRIAIIVVRKESLSGPIRVGSEAVLPTPLLPQDDIIDDVDSFVAAAETLKERGAYKIFIMATHGILSCDAPRFIEESAIDEVRPFVLTPRPPLLLFHSRAFVCPPPPKRWW